MHKTKLTITLSVVDGKTANRIAALIQSLSDNQPTPAGELENVLRTDASLMCIEYEQVKNR